MKKKTKLPPGYSLPATVTLPTLDELVAQADRGPFSDSESYMLQYERPLSKAFVELCGFLLLDRSEDFARQAVYQVISRTPVIGDSGPGRSLALAMYTAISSERLEDATVRHMMQDALEAYVYDTASPKRRGSIKDEAKAPSKREASRS